MAGRASDESVKGQVFCGCCVPGSRLQGVGALDEPFPRQGDLHGHVVVTFRGLQQIKTGGQHRVGVVEQVRVQKWTERGCVLRQNPGASNHRLGLPAGQEAPAKAGVGGRSETLGEVARLTSHRRSPHRKRP